MLRFTQGSIFRQGSDAPVNPVTCVGVMGAGLALQFVERFPDCFPSYRQACLEGSLLPGHVLVSPSGRPEPRWIVQFPTKQHWRDRSFLPHIDEGLRDLAFAIRHRRMRSIAVPPLGCGLGGLSWAAVRPLILAQLGPLSCEVIVLEPARAGAPAAPPDR